jgi:hypothetical protein
LAVRLPREAVFVAIARPSSEPVEEHMVVIPDTRRAWRWLLSGMLLALPCMAATAMQPPANDNPHAPLTFGILPIGGPAESL